MIIDFEFVCFLFVDLPSVACSQSFVFFIPLSLFLSFAAFGNRRLFVYTHWKRNKQTHTHTHTHWAICLHEHDFTVFWLFDLRLWKKVVVKLFGLFLYHLTSGCSLSHHILIKVLFLHATCSFRFYVEFTLWATDVLSIFRALALQQGGILTECDYAFKLFSLERLFTLSLFPWTVWLPFQLWILQFGWIWFGQVIYDRLVNFIGQFTL